MKFSSSKVTAFFFGSLLCGSLVFAQGGPGGPGRGPGGHGPGGPAGLGMRLGKVVTGAPFSATVTNTTVKTLADGNTIQHTTTGVVARDSAGRTYSQETITGMFGESGTKVVTFISDPVAGYVYTLDAATKTATRRAIHTPGAAGGPDGKFRDSAKGAPGARTSVEPAVTADLGTQLVNGVNATGKSVTRTIPAGQMGNEKPIVATTETWYSPDLQTVVSSKRSDPRQGTSIFALTNIQKGEPTSVSFTVPSDYTVTDAPKFGGRH